MSKDDNELRTHQYQDLYFEYDVPFLVDKAKKIGYLTYYGLGLFILILILGFVIRIPREVQLNFELKWGIKEAIGQYPDKVFMIERHVNIGDSLRKGMPIATISSEKIVKFLNTLTVIASDSIRFQTTALALYNENLNYSQIKLQRANIEKQHIESRKLNHELKFKSGKLVINEQVNIAATDLERNQMLFEKEVIAKRDLEIKEFDFKQLKYNQLRIKQNFETEAIMIEEQLAAQRSQIIELKQQIQLDSLTRLDQMILLKKRKHDIETQLKHSFGSCRITANGLVINSPYNGRVSLITAKEAQIAPGEMVWKIDIGSTAEEIICEANSQQIGNIRKGQLVILKFNSFPYFYYGTMSGEVKHVSFSPKTNGNYLVNIAIKNKKRLKDNSIVKGMTGEASVVVEENLPIFNYLFKSLFRDVE